MKQALKFYKNLTLLAIIGVPIGIVTGMLAVVFGKTLIKITEIRSTSPIYFLPFLPIIGLFIVYIYKKFGGKSIKGMSLIFEVAQQKEDKIPLRLIPLVIFTTWLTHLFGGSAGREGVAVQIGATFSNWVYDKLKIKNCGKTFLIIGMASGFSGLFQTPVSAIFFAIEVLIAGAIHYSALIPAITASFAASATSHFLGLEKFTFNLSYNINIDFLIVFKLIILGILFGIVGSLFALCLKYFKQMFKTKIPSDTKRIFIISIFLSVFLLLLHNGRYSGLGTNLINLSFNGNGIYFYDWLLKFLFTAITLSIGFQGGEVTPLFSIGASLGAVLATFFNLPIELVSSLGYISVFGSATNTFFAPIFIGGEVFGYEYMPFYFIVMSFAYIFNFNKSIYSLQQNSQF